MSLHKSLKVNNLTKKKNVLTKVERITKLMKERKWTETSPVIGLPKTEIIRMKAIKKEKKVASEPQK